MSLSLRLCLAGLAIVVSAALAQAQTVIWPPAINGCGTMSATAASAVVSATTLTQCAGSKAFPTPGGNYSVPVKVKVQSGATAGVYVCKLGGTCTAAAGELLAAGESLTFGVQNRDATTPITVLAVSGTQPIYVEW